MPRRGKRMLRHPLFELLILLLSLLSIYSWWTFLHQKQTEKQTEDVIVHLQEQQENDSFAFYEYLKKINPCCIGWVEWESGVIREPIVQGTYNTDWIRRDFYGRYDPYGTVFVDALADLSGDNITLYGHAKTGDMSSHLKFSALQRMNQQSYWQENHTLFVNWQGHIYHYKVAAACIVDTIHDTWAYEQNVFLNEEDKEKWMDEVIVRNEIESGIALDIEDHFLTFQTCVDENSGRRMVVIAVREEG